MPLLFYGAAIIQGCFQHCALLRFSKLRDGAGLDFYDTLRLINFIRTKAAETECQSVEAILELRKSLHAVDTKQKGPVSSITPEWTDDKFLTPFLENAPPALQF